MKSILHVSFLAAYSVPAVDASRARINNANHKRCRREESTMARIGVVFAGGMSPPDIVEYVKLAEELGYELALIAEGHGGDQFAILSACAVQTERILLGTGISSIFVRSAPTLAMAAASVDHFSNGGLIFGLGPATRSRSNRSTVSPTASLSTACERQRTSSAPCYAMDRSPIKAARSTSTTLICGLSPSGVRSRSTWQPSFRRC